MAIDRGEKPLTTAPAANNVVRYLDCTYAEIDFFRERDWLALLVSDNGNVFARVRIPNE
jgi:signal transduction histidine kinase